MEVLRREVWHFHHSQLVCGQGGRLRVGTWCPPSLSPGRSPRLVDTSSGPGGTSDLISVVCSKTGSLRSPRKDPSPFLQPSSPPTGKPPAVHPVARSALPVSVVLSICASLSSERPYPVKRHHFYCPTLPRWVLGWMGTNTHVGGDLSRDRWTERFGEGGHLLRSQWPLTGISFSGLCLGQKTYLQAEDLPQVSQVLFFPWGQCKTPPSSQPQASGGWRKEIQNWLMKNTCEKPWGWELGKLGHRDKAKFLTLYSTYDLDGRDHRMYHRQTTWSVSGELVDLMVTGEQTLPVAQVRWLCPGIWRDLFSFHSRVLTTKWEGVALSSHFMFLLWRKRWTWHLLS